LLVREIPEATAVATGTVQLPIALVLSLPVFITPPGARHAIECKQAEGQESGVIRCLNQGSAHAQVRRLELKQAGQIRASTQTSAYLLSGSQRDFSLKPVESPPSGPPPAGEFELTVWFDDGKTQTFGW
jgi:fimbrial chaperone protein